MATRHPAADTIAMMKMEAIRRGRLLLRSGGAGAAISMMDDE